MWALYVKEIRSFLSSLIGYIVIGMFLLVTGVYLWVYPGSPFNIFDLGTASLYSLFEFAPYIFLMLIPAITMRSFAEEKRLGTIELLMTKPVQDYSIIAAKFFAGLTLVILSILPTLTYYWCINELKTDQSVVDTGRMWGSYIGLFFIGSSYVAIGVFASALSSNQVVAFVIALSISLFVFLGFDGISLMLGSSDASILNLGISAHYKSIGKGLIDTRDIAYFISLTLVFIILTKLVLASRKW